MRISDWSSDVCSSDLVERARADIGDKFAQVPGDLRIGCLIVGGGGRDGAGLAELVDLDHIRNDAALHRLPHEARRQADGEDEAAKRHKSPVLRSVVMPLPLADRKSTRLNSSH